MGLQPFQTKARAIDHLGRGQIADCPTAVSELWKNSFDAYARETALHIFDGDPCIAAVFDDGHGMSESDFTSRWMVIGTESKLELVPPSKTDRNGLPERPRQGEKGIGRLSAAFLGPITILLSKRKDKFVVAVVDWRLFENPFLTLSDVNIPVDEFNDKSELGSLLPQMFLQSVQNLQGGATRRPDIVKAWQKFSEHETKNGLVPTRDRIASLTKSSPILVARILERVLPQWVVWTEDQANGTALLVIEAGAELAVWVEQDRDDDEYEAVRRLLLATLNGFVDPFRGNQLEDFSYSVVVHKGAEQSTIVSSDSTFGYQEFLSLEHNIIGVVDNNGIFSGQVRAFGVDQGAWTYSLRSRVVKPHLGPGPFEICVGTFEQDASRSTHPATVLSQLDELAGRYAGLAIYRDGLRVMPYGRPEADFFNIEERRSKHAGREFWSFRRTFGRVALTRDNNPNLRDKAGREGLIDNTARRELKELVIELLKSSARRFFNSESAVSQELLPSVRERNRLAKEAEKRAGDHYRTEFKERIRHLQARLPDLQEKSESLRRDLERHVKSNSKPRLTSFGAELDQFRNEVDNLTAPPRPKNLGRFESDYRVYRDSYRQLRQSSDQLVDEWSVAMEHAAEDDGEILSDMARRHRGSLKRLLTEMQKQVETSWTDVAWPSLRSNVAMDGDRYVTESQGILSSVDAQAMTIMQGVKALDELRGRLHHEFADKYGEIARSMRQLAQGVELGAATIWSSELRSELESQISQLTSLAQLGVTVEIVGHEFETVDQRIRDQLRRLPAACREGRALANLRATIDELIGRLRFLGPLRISGQRLKEDITGETISQHITTFFGDEFASRKISFQSTEGFRNLIVRDYAARIIPVFLNIISNAVYWVTKSERARQIRLSAIDGAAVISDSGPGIDPDDELSLFRLFFSRRVGGRGVGLYLCRQNLAAGGHTIELARSTPFAVLPGANFVIRFQGIS